MNREEIYQTKEFKEGFSAAKKYDSDPDAIENPYKENTDKWERWNYGWNQYDS